MVSENFGYRVSREAARTDSHPKSFAAKVRLREFALDGIGADKARVFDAYAGDGAMYRAVWHKAADYVGCDLEWYRGSHKLFVCDNRRLLRYLDLSAFNIFDLDAYGAPWEQAIIIAARRTVGRGERIAFVFTEGSSLRRNLGGWPLGLRVLAGIRPGAAGGGKSSDELVDRCIAGLCHRMQVRQVNRWQVTARSHSHCRYGTTIVEGL